MKADKNKMYFLEVAPVVKNAPKEPVSYFSSYNLKPGALVKVSLKKKQVFGVVVKSISIKDKKIFLKKSEFSLKAIKNVVFENFLGEDFIKAAKKISDFFVCSLGSTIYSLVDKHFFDSPSLFFSPKGRKLVFILFSGKSGVQNFTSEETGVLNLKFWSGMPKKEFNKNIKFLDDKKNNDIEIAATSKFLPLFNKNFERLVIRKEFLKSYKTRVMPYLDYAFSAEIMSESFGVRSVFSADSLTAEDFKKISESKEKIPENLFKKEKKSGREEVVFLDKAKENAFLSDEIKNIISNGSSLFFINKRGYYNFAVCLDCGKVVLCDNCSSPLKIHLEQDGKNRTFLCHYCFFKNFISNLCKNCGSHNLKAFGFGAQKIEEEIKKEFGGKKKIMRLDSDILMKKGRQAEIEIKEFLEEGNGILIATEIVFSFLAERGAPRYFNNVIAFPDNMFNIPDFKIGEKIFMCLSRLKQAASDNFLIISEFKSNGIFDKVLKGDYLKFYEEELKSRKTFFYPPFSVLIKITKEEKNKENLSKEIADIKDDLAKILGEDKVFSFPSFIEKVKNKYRINILLKLEAENWPYEYIELLNFLRNLPFSFRVLVNPDSVL